MKNKKLIYTLGMAFMLLDQLIKLVVTKNMDLNQEITIISNFFSIYYLKNTGAAFSILGNKTLFLIIVSIICLLILKNYIKNLKNITSLTIISLGIMLGGIIGNLFDRLLYKAVIDYLSFNIFGYSFPVFNLADIGITIGTLLLVVEMLITEQKNKSLEKKQKIWYSIDNFRGGK